MTILYNFFITLNAVINLNILKLILIEIYKYLIKCIISSFCYHKYYITQKYLQSVSTVLNLAKYILNKSDKLVNYMLLSHIIIILTFCVFYYIQNIYIGTFLLGLDKLFVKIHIAYYYYILVTYFIIILISKFRNMFIFIPIIIVYLYNLDFILLFILNKSPINFLFFIF